MDNEKDFLKRDLSKAEGQEEIESIIHDAHELGHEDIVALAEQKLVAISAKVSTLETTSPAQVSQAERMGGSAEELTKRTEEVDQKIGEVGAEARRQIEEVQGETPSTSAPEVSNPPTGVNEKEKKEGLFNLTDTFETKQQLTDRLEKTMTEIAKQLQKYEQDLNQAQDSINSVKAMKPGSREKYDASYDMMHKVREKFEPFSHDPIHTGGIKGNMDSIRTPVAYKESQRQHGTAVDISRKEPYLPEIQEEYKPKLEVIERKFTDLEIREAAILKEMNDVLAQAKEEYSRAA